MELSGLLYSTMFLYIDRALEKHMIRYTVQVFKTQKWDCNILNISIMLGFPIYIILRKNTCTFGLDILDTHTVGYVLLSLLLKANLFFL